MNRKGMIYRRRHLTVLVMVAIILIASIWLIRVSLPGYLPVIGLGQKQTLSYDLNQDHQPELYSLDNGRLIISEDEREFWRSPTDWQVTSLYIADVTHDHQEDLLLVVWKKGSFGPARPFWDTGKDNRFSCHLYVFNLVNQRLKPIWMSSALDRPIKDMRIKDTNGDGKNEIMVTEYHPWWRRISVRGISATSEVTTWQWQEWGFYRLND